MEGSCHEGNQATFGSHYKEFQSETQEVGNILIQIEEILNSRPLTPLSADPDDFTSLTPGHFLVDTSLTSYPEPSLDAVPVNRLSRWQYIQLLRQHF